VLSAIPETAEPRPFFLEDTLAREAVGIHDRIQAGLGGVRLPTPIVEGDALIRDLSNQVTVKTDLSDVPVHGDGGVSRFPVTTLGDRGVHEAFDLAHGWLRLVDVVILDGHGHMGLEAVTVYPLALGVVAREPEHLKDGPTADARVAILSQGT
jgi:hypothetical protein